jgi:RNA polymerase sigma-70 factor (ECF subfamily)
MGDRPGADSDEGTLAGRLYDAHGASLYRYAVLLLADAVAAEDVIQQVFTALVRRPPVCVDDDGRYLRRAVRNACYSQLRRWRLRRRVFDEERPLIEPVADGVAPDARLAMERALRALPAEQREVVYLHVFEGCTFREIAEATDTSINTIAGRYRYALTRLKELLAL